MRDLVLNFLVYADKVANGTKQSELIKEAVDLGFNKVEVRREYFNDLAIELPEVKKVAAENNVELFYSVPDEVFVDGKINPKLSGYLKEAEDTGIKHIKWNIGDFTEESSLEELHMLTGSPVAINIENDQTLTSGTIEAIETFMKAICKADINVGYVYDLGNWRFVGEGLDEKEAAEKLKDYVRYIHVKDVSYLDDKPQAEFLDHGVLNWREILAILPQDVPVAIEYPTTANDQILEAKNLLEEE
ncbi:MULTISPECIES: sugar phosphate isomerase/epimerase family protein [Enterococcus]|uniref:Sugar phosphate isomerase n=1 Tax=Enterococcus alishanensis TaxID=1303817 RepID=A0ABS6TD26_9ENTE|nr:TIM barrel protein [Enterococcus alishanensis]MBV7390830.1 sugar phosphate isomerase [Enterococcus alishanensis]